jgi:hypothetical protein
MVLSEMKVEDQSSRPLRDSMSHVSVWRTKNKTGAHEERNDSDKYHQDEKSYRQKEQPPGHRPVEFRLINSLPSGDARSLQSFSTIP